MPPFAGRTSHARLTLQAVSWQLNAGDEEQVIAWAADQTHDGRGTVVAVGGTVITFEWTGGHGSVAGPALGTALRVSACLAALLTSNTVIYINLTITALLIKSVGTCPTCRCRTSFAAERTEATSHSFDRTEVTSKD